ncbi:2'-5' RNA ligase family protein [Rufibacter roseus]|uniref:2'-5' RNA ligase family protein n=1 Tax=Rufibacter roseus TaxID=1567108 RepID=A0ABW2DF59_9BACT|nr:mutarotase [Rufibacter roseus]
MDLNAHYTQLWDTARQRIEAGEYEVDPLIGAPADTRRGLTLVARPSTETKERMQAVLQELKQLEPEQYAYPIADLHLTLLSIISCYPDFKLSTVSVEEYVCLTQETFKNIHPFTVNFTGVTASASCVMAQGFPADATLEQLRNQLRRAFKSSGLQQTIDSRYTIQTAHATLLRFRKPLRHPQKLLNTLEHLRDYFFGASRIHEVELVYNDWYQRQQHVQVLAKFPLT